MSYSKVREATRVVGLVDEKKLCQLALTATASQLARMVSGYRTAAGSRIRQQPARALTWTERDDEMIDFRIRLPKEEAALIIAALSAAKDQFGAPPPAPKDQPSEQVNTTPAYGYADAILDVSRGFLETAPEGPLGGGPHFGGGARGGRATRGFTSNGQRRRGRSRGNVREDCE